MKIRNFLFHRVSEEIDEMWPPMKPFLFTKIIGYLQETYDIVPLESYLLDPGAFNCRRKIATVMFDDGFKDNLDIAAPILQKFKCPASFYVVSGCIDNDIPTWTYLVDNVFQATRIHRLELPFDFVPAKFQSLDLVNNPVVKELKPWLKTLPNFKRLKVIRTLLDQCNDVPLPSGKMMNWEGIRQLASSGFIIGSHSTTHPMLASLTDESEINDELLLSRDRIKDETGVFPLSISYPIGSYDDRVKNLSIAAGYKFGLAVKQQIFDTIRDDHFEIPRVELYQEPWWKVRMRTSGWYSLLKNLRP